MSCIVSVNRSARSEHSKLIEFNEEPIVRKDPVKCSSPQGTIPLGTVFGSNQLVTRLVDLVHFVGVTSIGSNAFMGSSNLLCIVIPANVTSMVHNSIRNNTKLEYVKLLPSSVISIGSNGLYDTNNCPVYVSDELVQSYKTASNWSQYASRFKSLSEFPD